MATFHQQQNSQQIEKSRLLTRMAGLFRSGRGRSRRKGKNSFESVSGAASEALEQRSLMTAISVTTLDDVVDASDGLMSLREALNAANAKGGDDQITFDAGLFVDGQGTITLEDGQLALRDTNGRTTISGPGSEILHISGGAVDRIFSVQAEVDALISGLTLKDGTATSGGGIANAGSLEILNVTLTNNVANGEAGANGRDGSSRSTTGENGTAGKVGENATGGAIRNDGELIVAETVFTNNTARGGSGGSGGNGGSGGRGRIRGYAGGNGAVGGRGGSASGGAIYNSETGSVILRSSSFEGNSASGGIGGSGGAGGTGGSHSRIFYGGQGGNAGGGGNTGDAAGGAVFNAGTLAVNDLDFEGNRIDAGQIASAGVAGAGGSARRKGASGSPGTEGSMGVEQSPDIHGIFDEESVSARSIQPAPRISLPGLQTYDGSFVTDVKQKPAAAGSVTLEFRTDKAQNGFLLGHYNHGNPNHRIYVNLRGSDLYVRLGSGGYERVAQNVTDGQWHQLTFVYGGQPDLGNVQPSVYLDGQLAKTVTASPHGLVTTSELKIGGITTVTPGGTQLHFTGEIRNVNFYDTLFTAEQVDEISRQTEDETSVLPSNSVSVTIPDENPTLDHLSDDYLSQFEAGGGVTSNRRLANAPPVKLGATVNVNEVGYHVPDYTGEITYAGGGSGYTDIAVQIGSTLGSIFSGGGADGSSNPFGNVNTSQNKTTTQAGQVLYGGKKADSIRIKHKNTVALLDKGNDQAIVTASGATVYGNIGNDTFELHAENAKLVGGIGKDTYKLRGRASNIEILDASPDGVIDLADATLKEISLSRTGTALRLKTVDGRSLTFHEFAAEDRVGWSLVASNGTFSLQNLVQPRTEDLFRVALTQYKNAFQRLDSGVFGLGKGEILDDSRSGLQATAYLRMSIPATIGDLISGESKLCEPQAIVGVRGTEFTGADAFKDISADLRLAQPQIEPLAQNIIAYIERTGVTSITIIGHSLGGMDAVGAARIVASRFPGVHVSALAINAAGVPHDQRSGYELTNLDVTYMQHEFDILHRLTIANDLDGGLPIQFDSAVAQSIWNAEKAKYGLRDDFDLNIPLTVYPDGAKVVHLPGNPASPDVFENWGANHSLECTAPMAGFALGACEAVVHGTATRSRNAVELPVEEIYVTLAGYIQNHAAAAPEIDVPEFEAKFDVGTPVDVRDGFETLQAEDVYDGSQVLGWTTTGVQTKDSTIGNDLQRDYAVGEELALTANLEAGVYDFTFHTGDEFVRQGVDVYVNDWREATIGSLEGEVRASTVRITHAGGELSLRLKDSGGTTAKAVLNGVEIRRVQPGDALTESSAREADPTLVVITPDAIEAVSWFDKVNAIVGPVKDIALTVASLASGNPITATKAITSLIKVARSTSDLVTALQTKSDTVAPWALQAQIAMNLDNARNGLPLLTPAKKAVQLTTVENTEAKQFGKLFGNSDVILIDSERQLNDGVKLFGNFGDGVKDEGDHREAMKRVETTTLRAIRWWINQQREGNPDTKTDILFVGAGLGAIANRGIVDRLAEDPLADTIDHVGLEMIAPIAVQGVSEFVLAHPETRPFSLSVANYWENKSDVPGKLIKNELLDGNAGGGRYGQLNNTAQVFQSGAEYTEQILRNLSKKQKLVDGVLSDVIVSNTGRYAALTNSKGFLSVFDLSNGSRLYDRRLFTENGIVGVRFSPDDLSVGVMNSRGRLAVMDLTAIGDTEVAKFDHAVDFLWSNDNSTLVIARKDGAILRVTRDSAGKLIDSPLQLLQAAAAPTRIWSHNGTIATYHASGELFIHQPQGNAKGANAIVSYQTHRVVLPRNLTTFDLSLDTSTLIAGEGTSLVVYGLDRGSLAESLRINDNASSVTAVTIGADGSHFAAGSSSIARVYDLTAAKSGIKQTTELFRVGDRALERLSLSNDGKVLLASLQNVAGGAVKDVRIRELIEARVSHFGDESRFHEAAPLVWTEHFVPKLRFFLEKDSDVTTHVFGNEQIWKNALPEGAVNRIPDDEAPLLDEDGNEVVHVDNSDWNSNVDKRTPTSVRVGFDQIPTAKKYVLTVYVKGTDKIVAQKTVNDGARRRRTTIENLPPNTAFEIVLQARNKHRIFATGERIVTATTDPQAVPGLRTTDVRHFQIDLQWESQNFTPSRQYIEVRRVGSTTWTRPVGSGVVIGREVNTIEKLTAGTSYEIRHVSELKYRDADNSQKTAVVRSNPIRRRTDAYPPVQNVRLTETAPTSVRVTFSRLSKATRYVVTAYFKGTSTVARQVTLKAGTGKSHTTLLRQLAPDKQYDVVVEAAKSGSTIAMSSRQQATTLKREEPKRPILAAGRRQISVNWLFPDDHDEAVGKVQIVRRLSSGKERVLKTVGKVSSRSTYLKNLNPRTTYQLFIRVIYNDGSRVNGEVSSVTTRR